MSVKIIGLTGGIGSGKTTIANYFMHLGVPVYIADDEAKNILYTPEAIAEVKDTFGEAVFTNGIPDRAKLSAVVFNDAARLAALNAIIHPKVRSHFNGWVKKHSSHKFIIKEAAILFESGSYKDCDRIILVTAPVSVRIKRVMERDNVSEVKVLERMANQWSDERKAALSDYIVYNNDLDEAKKQVLKIVKEL